jgi:hypothetical protein
MEWLGLARLCVAGASLALAAGVVLRKRHLSRHKLKFDAGIPTTMRENLSEPLKDCPLSFIAYGSSLPAGTTPIFSIPLFLENGGKLPIKGVFGFS